MVSPNKRKGAKSLTQGNDKEFWINLGVQIGKNLECSQSLQEEFHKFVSNDHAHLAAKVDKLAIRLAAIVGGITALSAVIQYLIK